MNNKIEIQIKKDKYNVEFFYVSLYKKYNFKQYILNNNFLYTFFIIINFSYKYGFIKIKRKIK